MSDKPKVVVLAWTPDGWLQRLTEEFTDLEYVDGREPAALDQQFAQAAITYGLPPIPRLVEATHLRWIQLVTAGVPQDLCRVASERGLKVTSLVGLYGSSIAEHALGLMVMLARNLHVAHTNQNSRRWDRDVRTGMTDLHGRTLAIVGVGNIGSHIGRLARGLGMRVLGCCRTQHLSPWVDRMYPLVELHSMLSAADVVAVAAPLTRHTEGMLGPAEFAAMKRGTIYVNVSRGAIAQEKALHEALETGHVRAAGLDAFAVEPLPAENPLWTMRQVVISPHYSGETVNYSSLPVERFARNLRCWLAGRELEGGVNLEWGY
jgi:phosphoglycerate dehydrogenase-like enzyme